MNLEALKNIFSQLSVLYIIYNIDNNKIEWCNKYKSEDSYDNQISSDQAFFIAILSNEIKDFETDWNRCLELQNNESHCFVCSLKNQVFTNTYSINAENIWVQETTKSYILLSCHVLEKNPFEDRLILLQQKLQDAVQDKERLELQKNDFIFLASHDLQAPVRKWNAYMEKWRMKNEHLADTQTLFYADRMSVLSKQMYSLIDDLNLLVELKDHALLEYCDLNKVVSAALSEMNAVLPADASVVLRDALPAINGNAAQLKNLFTQLIYNSIIFKKENYPLQMLITVSVLSDEDKKEFSLDENTAYCKIIVADNGVGFNQEYSNQIFQPFYKLEGKRNGMGLAICKQIVENHKGHLYAKGETGVGAQFILIIPSL